MGFFFGADHKDSDSLAKIRIAVSLFKLGSLGSTDVQIYETGSKQNQKKEY